MGKRILALLTCVFAAALFALPVTAWAYGNTPPTSIFVNNVDITQAADHRVTCGDGYAEFDDATGVLTLNNADITKTYFNPGGITGADVPPGIDSGCGIYSGNEVDLVINLVGESAIAGGIQAWGSEGPGGDITVQGEGTLRITADKVCAINAHRDLTISGATVYASSAGGTTFNAQRGAVRIENGAHVEVSTYGSSSYAIGAAQPNSASGDTNIVVSGEGTYLKAESPGSATSKGFPTLYSANDIIIEDGAHVEVYGSAAGAHDVIVQSNAKVVASSENISFALTALNAMKIENANVSASSLEGYGIRVSNGLIAKNAVIDARSGGSNGLLMGAGDVVIEEGTVTVTSDGGVALQASNCAVRVTGCILTLESPVGTNALACTSLDPGDGNSYQWATSPVAASKLGADDPYTSVDSHNNYLRFEPVGTTYELDVENGEGGGSYAAGTPVTISADAYTASGHFGDWAITEDPTGAVVLADASAAETTFIMPAGNVTLTANYANHDLSFKHHDAKAPTCTEAGWEAYDECACGYSTYKVAPATDHDWGEPAWSWNDDYTEFVATFTCANDPAHTEELTAKPTASVQAEPTCTEPGTMLYSATVELGGKKYEATATAEIPAAGHTYKDGVCTVCGAEDPGYVAPEKDDSSIPATGDMSTFFSAMPALIGTCAVAAGAVLRRRR